MQITKFEDIDSWKEARLLVTIIYELRINEDFNRDYSLKDQITRAAVSIMSNIAEGFDSGTSKSFIRFLNIAYGSASEVQSLLYILVDRTYITQRKFEEIYGRIGKIKNLIGAFIKYLNSKKTPKTKN